MTTVAQIEQALMARFAELGIETEIHRHPPLHTVAESKQLRGTLPGAHIKNLFLRDKKRALWLATVLEDREIDLKRLRTVIGARGNLSFGSAELLAEALGVAPGAVTPLAVLNDPAQRVQLVFDKAVLAQSPVNAHPLHNEATIAIAPDDLLHFVRDCGHEPQILDFAAHLRSQT